MKKSYRVILIVLAVLLAVVLIAAIVIEAKYAVFFAAPRISHEEVAFPHTSLLIRIDPSLAQGYIAKRLVQGRRMLERALPKLLPYEIAVMMDPDLTAGNQASGKIGIEVFVNDQRLGPVLAKRLTQSGLLSRFPQITWSPPEVVRRKKGMLILEGSAPISQASVTVVRDRWGVVTPLSPLRIEGGHLFEGVLDLRDGRGFALVAEMLGRSNRQANLGNVADIMKNIAMIRLTADLASDTEMALHLRIECRPEVQDAQVNSLKFIVNYGSGQAAIGLQQSCNAVLSGNAEVDGINIVGDYKVTNFDRIPAALAERR